VIVLALGFTLGEDRRRIAKILPPIAGAYAVTLLLAGPYLYFMFAHPGPAGQFWSDSQFSADVLNFLIPTQVNLLGGLYAFHIISAKFQGNIFECGAYIEPVLIALVLAYAWRHWREPFGKLLVDSLIIIWVLSLGPILHVGGKWLSPLPGKLFSVLPLLDKALPTRFTMYAFAKDTFVRSRGRKPRPTPDGLRARRPRKGCKPCGRQVVQNGKQSFSS